MSLLREEPPVLVSDVRCCVRCGSVDGKKGAEYEEAGFMEWLSGCQLRHIPA